MMYFIGAVCAFFTLLVIFRPNWMWSILAGISYMLLLWYVQTYAPFTLGTLGNVIFICICIGGAVFCLLWTVNDVRQKREEAEKEARENGEYQTSPTNETADEYHARLLRIFNPKKK